MNMSIIKINIQSFDFIYAVSVKAAAVEVVLLPCSCSHTAYVYMKWVLLCVFSCFMF